MYGHSVIAPKWYILSVEKRDGEADGVIPEGAIRSFEWGGIKKKRQPILLVCRCLVGMR